MRSAIALFLPQLSEMHPPGLGRDRNDAPRRYPASMPAVRLLTLPVLLLGLTSCSGKSLTQVRGEVRGLAPNSEHGFHVHEKGDCSSGDGMSAGGHFNPTAMPHGPQAAPHHAGDLPSIVADASGVARFSVRTSGVVLGGGADDLAGKGLIVHANPDDYTTQPTGNSGGRIACGVISGVAGRDAAGREQPLPQITM